MRDIGNPPSSTLHPVTGYRLMFFFLNDADDNVLYIVLKPMRNDGGEQLPHLITYF